MVVDHKTQALMTQQVAVVQEAILVTVELLEI